MKTTFWGPLVGKRLCSYQDSKLLAELCTEFKMMLSPSVALYVKQLLCHGIILCVCVYLFPPPLWLPIWVLCMLNSKPKRIWLRKILGCLWEAGAWILGVSLQLGAMWLLEGLNCSEGNSHSVQWRSVLTLWLSSSTSIVIVQCFVDRMRDFFVLSPEQAKMFVVLSDLQLSPRPPVTSKPVCVIGIKPRSLLTSRMLHVALSVRSKITLTILF